MKANRFYTYLLQQQQPTTTTTTTRATQVFFVTAMLQDEFNCKYCRQLNVCTMYHKSVEHGDKMSAGMGNLFEKSTSHLSPEHLKYFSHWNELIALETRAMQVLKYDLKMSVVLFCSHYYVQYKICLTTA